MRSGLKTILCLAVAAGASLTAARPAPPPSHTFTNRTIYDPPDGGRASYPRVAELRDGTLLVTASIRGGSFSDGLPSFPIFESKDGGLSWKWVSNLTDQVNGWGMSAQPALLELREPLGGFRPGTILASGNSWSSNGTRIDLYASTDKARSWEFVSHVAQGGRPNTTNGATPIWEPFLLTYNHELICYYSDQRDPEHGQKLAHQRSKDLKSWGPVVNDVRYDEYLARPGMTVVAKVESINKWIVVFERPIGNSSSYGSNYPVHYRLADKPTEFDSAESIPIVIGGTFAPNASPYVVWSPVGGPNGTIVVSDADHSEVYTNRRGGDPDAWEIHPTGQPPAYSRALHVFEKHPDKLAVIGGATFDDGGPDSLSLSVLSLTKLLETKPPA
ncbi:hypothetical protein MFIFM68171_07313 [Madurella fahalii]|uniref:Glycoside hydrolase family 93 protein n=1 Tax=Madurella fahalii TaxID=1157608 RepID=A0ABQ0GH64_9PEZI